MAFVRPIVLISLVAACSFEASANPTPKLRVVQLVAPGKTPDDFRRAIATEMDVGIKEIGALATAKDLASYDVVVLSDVPAHLVGAAQVTALDAYVKGGGVLLAAGGLSSFGSGGYQATRVEQLLPVRFDAETTRSQPEIAVAIIVDTTDAMKGPLIGAAIPAIAAFADGLAPNDIVGVIGFGGDAKVWVRPRRAANREQITATVKTITTSGATANLFAGLRESYELLQSVSARKKHAIVLSAAPVAEQGIAELVDDMRASRITVSAFAGPKAPRQLLAGIAKAGDGRFSAVADPTALGKLFATELATIQKATASDKTSARIAKHAPVIDGSGIDKAPPLHGYVTTKPKPTSEVLLITDAGEPLFARWCHGAGTVAVWTTDLDGSWSAEWTRWAGYTKFWTQLVHDARMKCATN